MTRLTLFSLSSFFCCGGGTRTFSAGNVLSCLPPRCNTRQAQQDGGTGPPVSGQSFPSSVGPVELFRYALFFGGYKGDAGAPFGSVCARFFLRKLPKPTFSMDASAPFFAPICCPHLLSALSTFVPPLSRHPLSPSSPYPFFFGDKSGSESAFPPSLYFKPHFLFNLEAARLCSQSSCPLWVISPNFISPPKPYPVFRYKMSP